MRSATLDDCLISLKEISLEVAFFDSRDITNFQKSSELILLKENFGLESREY